MRILILAAATALLAQAQQSRAGSLAHLAAGDGWLTTVSLVNPSPGSTFVTIQIHGDNGTPLLLPLSGTLAGASQKTVAATLTATLPANSTWSIEVGNLNAPLSTGSIDVLASGDVDGFAIFRHATPNGVISEGTVPLQGTGQASVVLPFDNTGGNVTGVALTNLGPAASTITAIIYNEDGAQLGVQSFPINASGHRSFAFPDLLGPTANRRGFVRFQNMAGFGLAGLGLRFNSTGGFTSVPLISPMPLAIPLGTSLVP